jgi:hypothetical protein
MEDIRRIRKAEKENRLIILPCRIGTRIYKVIVKRSKNKNLFAYVTTGSFGFDDVDKFGESIFLTEAEAKKRLDSLGL